MSRFDVEAARFDFPTLHQKVKGKDLVYLDSAATAHKPKLVIETMRRFYQMDNANVHRGVHELSERATLSYEGARRDIQRYLNAASHREIVFTRGTTEAINLVSNAWGRANLHEGDEILLTWMEHHSNIVPWQLIAEATGAVIKVAPIHDDGSLDMEAFEALLGPRTRMVAVAHVSNALGTVNPVRRIIELAHAHGALVLVDGAQGVPHMRVDVQALGADFYALSGHKLYGPTGIGVLYGRLALLEAMPPWQGGGDMIRVVTFEKTEYAPPPARFEAGTPNISGAIGLGAAVRYLNTLDFDAVHAHELDVLRYGTALLEQIPGVRIVGTAEGKVGVISFLVEGVHPHDLGTALDMEGVAVRTGHHCAQPVMQRMAVFATTRASLGLYNTREDMDRLADALRKSIEVFR
ncbi:MAG: cysteine desulfurase [Deltaproteobacteria bacterium]|nr:cysteine desulfurase [Deltaproteobacteria bacterium]